MSDNTLVKVLQQFSKKQCEGILLCHFEAIVDKEISELYCQSQEVLGGNESVYIETKKPIDIDKAFELLSHSHGVDLYDDIENQIYPMTTLFIGDELVHVGKVRKDLNDDHALSMWIVSGELMKGAAYNSVDIGLI